MIVRFLRAALQDMEAAGGHVVNSDETFWRDFNAKVSRIIQHNDRLNLLAQTGNAAVGYLEGNSRDLHEVFAPKKSFHLNAIYNEDATLKSLNLTWTIIQDISKKTN